MLCVAFGLPIACGYINKCYYRKGSCSGSSSFWSSTLRHVSQQSNPHCPVTWPHLCCCGWILVWSSSVRQGVAVSLQLLHLSQLVPLPGQIRPNTANKQTPQSGKGKSASLNHLFSAIHVLPRIHNHSPSSLSAVPTSWPSTVQSTACVESAFPVHYVPFSDSYLGGCRVRCL